MAFEVGLFFFLFSDGRIRGNGVFVRDYCSGITRESSGYKGSHI